MLSCKESNASESTGVFSNEDIYFCDGVVGEKFPNLSELRAIVKCGKGRILTKLGTKKVDSLIVVTSDPDEKKKYKQQTSFIEENATDSIKQKKGKKGDDAENFLIMSNKEFLRACMAQEIA